MKQFATISFFSVPGLLFKLQKKKKILLIEFLLEIFL